MTAYVGRFAPTPSGHLHLGSVIAAVGSYLISRHNRGCYLIRIEDLDTPRCKSENTAAILDALDKLALHSDKEILIQSKDTKIYHDKCAELLHKGYAFYCSCSRSDLKQRPCTCYKKHLSGSNHHSLRFYHKALINSSFYDDIKGKVCVRDPEDNFITLIRADGIISYNLACVVDDIRQNVSHIVRGSDLIDVTPVQNALYKAFGCDAPGYMHLPLAVGADGLKLSKQNHAADILSLMSPQLAIKTALLALGQRTDYIDETMICADILHLALENLDISAIPSDNIVIDEIQLHR